MTSLTNVIDIDGVDEGLGQFYSGVLFNIVTLTVSMSIMAYGVPQFLIVAVLLGYLVRRKRCCRVR